MICELPAYHTIATVKNTVTTVKSMVGTVKKTWCTGPGPVKGRGPGTGM